MSDQEMRDPDTSEATAPLTRWQTLRLWVWRARRTVYELTFPVALAIGAAVACTVTMYNVVDRMPVSVLGLLCAVALGGLGMTFFFNVYFAVLDNLGAAKRLRRYRATYAALSRQALQDGKSYRRYAKMQEKLIRDDAFWERLGRMQGGHEGSWVMTGVSIETTTRVVPPEPAEMERPAPSGATWGGRRRHPDTDT